MKKLFKKIALLCLIIGAILTVCSCDNEETPEPTPTTPTSSSTIDSGNNGNVDDNEKEEPEIVDYKIMAVDAFGNNISAVVEMFKDGESLGEMPTRQGIATFRQEKGDYTFEIEPLQGEYYYDVNECILSNDVTEKTITLYAYADSSNKQEIWVYDETIEEHIPYEAVSVSEGGMYVNIDRPALTYFIFTPTRGGIYRFSCVSDKKVTFGYYGSPHNVLKDCPIDVTEDSTFEIEIKDGSVAIGNQGGTSQYVIGVRTFATKNCIIKIERIGNATVDLEWTDVHANRNETKKDNYLNSEFVDFDVTNPDLKVVFNENDGYYHLNTVDGPLVYLRISTAVIKGTIVEGEAEYTEYKYLAPFTVMCETGRLGKIYYDDNGKIVLKECYNEMFKEYAQLCGTKGVYPLNKQLEEAIKNIGTQEGWFDLDSESNLCFKDDTSSVVEENAWLFACCYENMQALGTSERPAPITAGAQDNITTEAIFVTKGEEVTLRTITKAKLTVKNPEGVKIIANDGTEYQADSETGKLEVIIKANQNFVIVYDGEEAETAVRFTFAEYFGE